MFAEHVKYSQIIYSHEESEKELAKSDLEESSSRQVLDRVLKDTSERTCSKKVVEDSSQRDFFKRGLKRVLEES